MILSIVFIVLIALIAFVHSTQGFFSSTISAVIAVVAAMLAVGWQEDVVAMIKPGPSHADSMNAIILCTLFGAAYLIPKLLIDKLVPGNVRYASSIDKVGAVIMGIVAGIFGTGIIAIAIQTMGFGISIAGYSRYTLAVERVVTVGKMAGQSLDRKVYDELKSPNFSAADVNSLLFPVDSIVLGMAASDSSGALSGKRPLTDIHPDYLQELFGQRLGIEIGARRTAANWQAGEQIEVKGLYTYTATGTPRDQEPPETRGFHVDEKKGNATDPLIETQMQAGPDVRWLVVRIEVKSEAGDSDSKFRFAPAAARLCIKSGGKFENFFPVGTLDYQRSNIWVNRIDDTILLNSRGENTVVDLVYKLPQSVLTSEGSDSKKGTGTFKLPPGSFFEMKRFARADLTDESEGGGPIKPYTTAPKLDKPSVLRKMVQDERVREKKDPQ